MTAVKERIMGAVTLMNNDTAEKFWKLIQNHYIISSKNWEGIEEAEPDEIDLLMLKEIESDPDCHEFISSDELMKELGF